MPACLPQLLPAEGKIKGLCERCNTGPQPLQRVEQGQAGWWICSPCWDEILIQYGMKVPPQVLPPKARGRR